jgi:radical SAM superfamily enzyme YgiQ (UPF0313 family)
MYRDKRYRVRPIEEVIEDVDMTARAFPYARRVFICDGNALSAGFDSFSTLCRHIIDRFPNLDRISSYVNAKDILRLSPEELKTLRRLKFSLGYLGLESGSAEVLKLIRKGAASEDMLAMSEKAREADIALSVIVLLGAGGEALSRDHATGTIEVINKMRPKYLSFLTAMILPSTPLMEYVELGSFKPLSDKAILLEAREMLTGLDLNDTLFRMNHVSNLIALGGHLPADKAMLLAQLDALLPRADDQVTCIISETEGLML